MKKQAMPLRYFIFFSSFFILIFGGMGCSSVAVNENDPEALFKEAEAEIESAHYQIAIEKLRVIKNKFPYSHYAVDAHLRIGDVYFIQESYAEAAATYESFSELHPRHERVAYSLFKVAKSYWKDAPSSVARDLSPVKKAMHAYLEFLKRFSSVTQSDEAREDLQEVRKMLAGKEYSIAEFYFRQNSYHSAQSRFKKVIELYPETKIAEMAVVKLKKLEAHLEKTESEKNK